MTQPTLILGDIHARKKHVATVLHRAGVMDIHGNRIPGTRVIQLGDAVSLGYDELEADFYTWLSPFIDEWLIGNHELPVFWPNNDLNFYGWARELDIITGEVVFEQGRDTDCYVLVRERFERGEYKAATHVGKWLLTHAGVLPMYQRVYRECEATAEDIAGDLNKKWEWCLNNVRKDGVITGMWETDGGIFWVRFNYLRAGYNAKLHIPQIVGHTPPCGPKQHLENLWCIDTERGCSGLLTHDDGETFELITSAEPKLTRRQVKAEQRAARRGRT